MKKNAVPGSYVHVPIAVWIPECTYVQNVVCILVYRILEYVPNVRMYLDHLPSNVLLNHASKYEVMAYEFPVCNVRLILAI
jgi:hypothetical protein